MNRTSKRRVSWLGTAIILLIAIFLGREWLPPELRSTVSPSPPATTASAPADALAGFAAEERGAIEKTWALIRSDGPFPYSKDGTEFRNREGRLPGRESGYYREFTVETPGSPDRGARRLVTGRNGEVYYTRDHYQTFIRLN